MEEENWDLAPTGFAPKIYGPIKIEYEEVTLPPASKVALKDMFKTIYGQDFKLDGPERYVKSNQKNDMKKCLDMMANLEMPFKSTNSAKYNGVNQYTKETDYKLAEEFSRKMRNPRYRSRIEERQGLPIWQYENVILEKLQKYQVMVVCGETGSGKSTQVPQFILDNYLSNMSEDPKHYVNIVVTEPKKVSASSLAERVAYERNEELGLSAGYQVRFEGSSSSNTRILYCTVGTLFRKLVNNQNLNNVSHVIVDEVHERSEESDFLLLILKRILKERKNLQVILMSATTNAEEFLKYFENSCLVQVPGRSFPVKVIHLEDLLEETGYTIRMEDRYSRRKIRKRVYDDLERVEYDPKFPDFSETQPYVHNTKPDESLDVAELFFRYKKYSRTVRTTLCMMDLFAINFDLIVITLEWIIQTESRQYNNDGSILVFLPGIADINKLERILQQHHIFSGRDFEIIRLHSSIAQDEQRKIFRNTRGEYRKIILATNIAESSITINDCVYVIDTGKCKGTSFQSRNNIKSLQMDWISQASAIQRMGRAGRVRPGVCIRLYTSHQFEFIIEKMTTPEILRMPLENTILRIKTLEHFRTQDPRQVLRETIAPPYMDAMEAAIETLQLEGIIDKDEAVTDLGWLISTLPAELKVGKMIAYGVVFRCLDSILTIAACLSEESIFRESPYPNNDREDRNGYSNTRLSNTAIAKMGQLAATHLYSDHLRMLYEYKQWYKARATGSKRGYDYATRNNLSARALERVIITKRQFIELLMDSKIIAEKPYFRRNVHTDDVLEVSGPHLNENGNIAAVLLFVVNIALYPNIVCINKYNGVNEFTKNGIKVVIDSRSVNYKLPYYPRDDLTFLRIMESYKTVVMYDCSPISPLEILLCSSDEYEVTKRENDITIRVDGYIYSVNSFEDVELIDRARLTVRELLSKRLQDPVADIMSCESKIITTILDLITTCHKI